MQSFEEAGKTGKEFVDSGLKSFAALSKGFQAISVETADYSRKAFEGANAVTEKVMTAKSLDKALEVQADYLKDAYESFVAQATKVTDLYADMAKDAFLPFESALVKAK